jgi:3-hydroxyisobutyrate dehydrogenase
MLTVFFVGLGHMGCPMALNLIKAGYRVLGFDLQREATQRFKDAGGQVAKGIGDAAGADVCITMLQTGEQVREACLGQQGVFAQLKAGSLYIDCSSIDVISSHTVNQAAMAFQLDAIDAPVSGGVAGAAAGTLTFMVGGEVKAFNRAKPMLSAMGKNVIHAGAAGHGQISKICNNMILGVSMIAVSEAFILAEKLGLSPQKLFEIVNVASGQCWVMSKYVPVPDVLPEVPANHDYQPGFTAQMMLKDLHLSQTAAEQAQVKTPMGAKATELYEQLTQEGLAQFDFSVILQWLKTRVKHE